MIVEEIKLQEGISEASLTAYLQASTYNSHELTGRPAVIVCPGGAFLGYTEKEAEPVALRFISEGYQAFVLKYSIGDMAHFPAPIIDAAKAVWLVREHAERWGINPYKISLCGFSAGAYVVAALGAMWQEAYLAKALNVEKNSFKPNSLILGYPILDLCRFRENNQGKTQEMNTLIEMMSRCIYGTATPTETEMMEWDVRSRINSGYPPTFLWTSLEDSFVDVEQSLDFIKELAVNGIRYEYHLFEKGVHGSSLGSIMAGFSEDAVNKLGNTPKWVDLALKWLKDVTD
ncbi:MAG: alpha/beta hydrolase [Herbinix sp.]|jgi:acetyl esterase/lipase|nr:alpha/beta hydrolase [Herbinix sp.]